MLLFCLLNQMLISDWIGGTPGKEGGPGPDRTPARSLVLSAIQLDFWLVSVPSWDSQSCRNILTAEYQRLSIGQQNHVIIVHYVRVLFWSTLFLYSKIFLVHTLEFKCFWVGVYYNVDGDTKDHTYCNVNEKIFLCSRISNWDAIFFLIQVNFLWMQKYKLRKHPGISWSFSPLYSRAYYLWISSSILFSNNIYRQ